MGLETLNSLTWVHKTRLSDHRFIGCYSTTRMYGVLCKILCKAWLVLVKSGINLTWHECYGLHYGDVMMSAMASKITSVSIVYSTVCSGADQRIHESPASLALVRGIHRWPVNPPPPPHKGPVTRKMVPCDCVNMIKSPATPLIVTLNLVEGHIDGLEQGCSISNALPMELLQSYAKPW